MNEPGPPQYPSYDFVAVHEGIHEYMGLRLPGIQFRYILLRLTEPVHGVYGEVIDKVTWVPADLKRFQTFSKGDKLRFVAGITRKTHRCAKHLETGWS
jgi:hypothetical protein